MYLCMHVRASFHETTQSAKSCLRLVAGASLIPDWSAIGTVRADMTLKVESGTASSEMTTSSEVHSELTKGLGRRLHLNLKAKNDAQMLNGSCIHVPRFENVLVAWAKCFRKRQHVGTISIPIYSLFKSFWKWDNPNISQHWYLLIIIKKAEQSLLSPKL